MSGGAYATIEGNVFDYNRHAVASDGSPYTGYMARFNYVLEQGHCQEGSHVGCFYNQHLDVHGTGEKGYGGIAGEYFDIAYTSFRGEQTYYLTKTRPAFMIRGSPTIGAFFTATSSCTAWRTLYRRTMATLCSTRTSTASTADRIPTTRIRQPGLQPGTSMPMGARTCFSPPARPGATRAVHKPNGGS